MQAPRGNGALRRIIRGIKNSARVREIPFGLEFQETIALITSNCFYCGSEPREREIWLEGGRRIVKAHGVDRIDSSVGYYQGNVVSCCMTCNRMKSDLSIQEFLVHVEKLALRSLDIRCDINGVKRLAKP